MVAQVVWFGLLDLFVHIIEMSYIDSRVKFEQDFFRARVLSYHLLKVPKS